MTCSLRSCPEEAVSTCLVGAGRRAPTCFRHEREMVDRDGYAVALPLPLAPWPGTAREAVLALQG